MDYDKTRAAFTAAFETLELPPPVWLQNSITDPLTKESLERGLDQADVLLVTGGATKQAYEKWRANDIMDDILGRVKSGDIVAAGGSAGAMIWFSQGYSDSLMYDVPEGDPWDYVLAQGSGLFKSWVTAHHTDIDNQGRDRCQGFIDALQTHQGNWEQAVGIDTGAALICLNGIATVKDISIPKKPVDHDVYIYGAELGKPRILTQGDTIDLAEL